MNELKNETFYEDSLSHHGVEGQKWGVSHGPPYPLDSSISTGKSLKEKIKASSENRKLYKKAKKRKAILKDPKKLAKHFDEFTDKELEDAINKYELRDKIKTYDSNESRLKPAVDSASKTVKNKMLQNKIQSINSERDFKLRRHTLNQTEQEAALERLRTQDQVKQIGDYNLNRKIKNVGEGVRVANDSINLLSSYKNLVKKPKPTSETLAGYTLKLNSDGSVATKDVQKQKWDKQQKKFVTYIDKEPVYEYKTDLITTVTDGSGQKIVIDKRVKNNNG